MTIIRTLKPSSNDASLQSFLCDEEEKGTRGGASLIACMLENIWSNESILELMYPVRTSLVNPSYPYWATGWCDETVIQGQGSDVYLYNSFYNEGEGAYAYMTIHQLYKTLKRWMYCSRSEPFEVQFEVQFEAEGEKAEEKMAEFEKRNMPPPTTKLGKSQERNKRKKRGHI